MILHIGELWIVLLVVSGFGALVGSIVQRAIDQSAARRPQAWLIRQIDRLVNRIEHRLMPWRLQVDEWEPPAPIIIFPPTFGNAPIATLDAPAAEPSAVAPRPPIAVPAVPIDRRRRGKRFRDAVARGDAAGARPLSLKAPRRASPDDLVMIKRIGKRNAAKLYEIGIYHFSQIAAWTPQEAAWVAAFLNAGEAIVAEDWVGQATRLASSESFPMVRPATEAPATLDAGTADVPADDG